MGSDTETGKGNFPAGEIGPWFYRTVSKVKNLHVKCEVIPWGGVIDLC